MLYDIVRAQSLLISELRCGWGRQLCKIITERGDFPDDLTTPTIPRHVICCQSIRVGWFVHQRQRI